MRMNKRARVLISAAFTLLLYLTMLSQRLFEAIDNYGAAMEIAGCFGADRVFVHISPSYCKLLGWISDLLPHASAFMLAERAIALAAMFALSQLILENAKSRFAAVAMHAGLAGTYGLLHIYSANYTVWTALFICVGWLMLASVQRSEEKMLGRRIAGYAFIAAGCVLRVQAWIMILPFMLLDMALRAWDGKRDGLGARAKKLVCLLLPAFVLMAAAGAEIYFTYIRGAYSEEYAYNSSRISVVDYPMKDYSEIENPFFSENDYECLTHWVLLDTDIVTREYLDDVHAIAGEKTALSPRTIYSAITDMLSETNDHIPLFLFTALLAVYLLTRKGAPQKLRAAFSVIGAGMILLYLLRQGRLPSRVVYCLCIGMLGNVFAAMLFDSPEGNKAMGVLSAIMAFAVLLSAGWVAARDAGELQSAFNARSTAADDEKDGYVYIWDMTRAEEAPQISPCNDQPSYLPSKDVSDHHLTMGDVSYGQKTFYDQLNRMGIRNPMRALIERENTFVAGGEENATRVLIWLREHYDESVRMEAVGEYGNATVWQYRTGE